MAQFDAINWRRLTHAYGLARNVPSLLRLLRDPTAAVREEATMELCNCINHQGSIYEATVAVVPCLFELAEDPSVPDRALVLGILGGISEGWTAAIRDQPLDPADWEICWRGIAHRMTSERPYREAAHRAVEGRLALLTGFLEDRAIEVRVAAVFVLATFLDRREEAVAALSKVIDEETVDWCRAAAIVALTDLVGKPFEGKIQEAAARRFRQIQTNEQGGPDSRLCAGLATLHLGNADKLEETLALARPRLSTDRQHFLRFPSATYSRNLFGLVCDSLRAFDEARVGWIREGLGHRDPEVVTSAFFEMSRLCGEMRWGPSRFLSDVLKLVESTDENVRSSAVSALSEIGREGQEYLGALTRHPVDDIREAAIRYVEGARLEEARRITQFHDKRPTRLPAVKTLIRLIVKHQDSPHWNDKQKICDALMNLGFHGPKASAATDQIRSLTVDTTPEVRIAAIRALWKVTLDAAVVVPLLLENLHPQRRYGFLVIEQLRELGPAARAALPALKQIVESPTRFGGERAFTSSCADDDAYRAASTTAIAAIE